MSVHREPGRPGLSRAASNPVSPKFPEPEKRTETHFLYGSGAAPITARQILSLGGVLFPT